jgi:hypothetical protein
MLFVDLGIHSFCHIPFFQSKNPLPFTSTLPLLNGHQNVRPWLVDAEELAPFLPLFPGGVGDFAWAPSSASMEVHDFACQGINGGSKVFNNN